MVSRITLILVTIFDEINLREDMYLFLRKYKNKRKRWQQDLILGVNSKLKIMINVMWGFLSLESVTSLTVKSGKRLSIYLPQLVNKVIRYSHYLEFKDFKQYILFNISDLFLEFDLNFFHINC